MYLDDDPTVYRATESRAERRLLVRSVIRACGMVASLCCLGVIFHWLGDNNIFSPQWLERRIDSEKMEGFFLFTIVGGMVASVGLPRQIIAFGGGYIFGLAQGFCLALVAQLLGCLLTFLYARFFARRLAQRLFSQKLVGVEHLLRSSPFTASLLIRLLPVGSNFLTNVLAGVTSVSTVYFVGGSVIGYIPQTLIFALLGAGIYVSEYMQIIISVVLFFVSIVLGFTVWHRLRRQARAPHRDFS